MRLRLLGTLILLLTLLMSTTAPVMADNSDQGKGKGKNNAARQGDEDRDRKDRGVSVKRRTVRDRDIILRRGVVLRDVSYQPQGWNRGRKTGWGNCDLPPGQAKKYGCSPAFLRQSRVVRFPIADGRFWLVRVPMDYRGWYAIDDNNRLWVDDRSRFWVDDRALVRLSIVVD